MAVGLRKIMETTMAGRVILYMEFTFHKVNEIICTRDFVFSKLLV